MKSTLFALLFSFSVLAAAQDSTLCKTWNAQDGSPAASLDQVSWIQGHWRGEAFGGTVEEIWSPPLGGSMMASFKLVVKEETKFYELMSILEDKNTLILKLKHFHSDLRGWEARDESIDFKLVELSENWVHFDGMSFEKVDAHSMRVYVVMKGESGEKEMRFDYSRYAPAALE